MSDDDDVDREFDMLFAQFASQVKPIAASTTVIKREPVANDTSSTTTTTTTTRIKRNVTRKPIEADDSSDLDDATHRRRKALEAADDDFSQERHNGKHGDDDDDDDDESISESELRAAIEADEAEEAALDAELDEDDDDDNDNRRRRRRNNARDVIDDDAELERLRDSHRRLQQQSATRVVVVPALDSDQFDASSTTVLGSIGRAARGQGNKSRRCEFPGCTKWGQGRKTAAGYRCARHGGGQRCLVPNCNMLNHGGGYCTAHGGGRRLVGARPRELKAATGPDVYRETFLKTNDVLESRKVALSVPVAAPPVGALPVAKAPKAAPPTKVNPIYLRPVETKVATVAKRRPASKQAKPTRKAAPTRVDAASETTIVFNAARYATRRGLSKFFNGASAVANDSADEFAAAAAYQHLASLPGAAPSFTVTPLVSVPYGSQAAYERLMRLDADGNGATLPLSAWWTQRREIIRVLDDRQCGGVIVKDLSLLRNLRKTGAIAPKPAPPRRSSPRRSPARAAKSRPSIASTSAAVLDFGSDGVSLEDVAQPPPVDLPSLILPDVVEPKPGFLDSLTPRPKRNAADVLMQAARANVPASAPPAAKRKRTGATPSKAAAEREKALFAKAEGRKPAKTRATATTETPSRESEVALLGLDTAAVAAPTTTKRSTRSEKPKEFFHLRTGGWFDNRMAGEQKQHQEQQQQQEQHAAVDPQPQTIDDGIGQDEFA